VLEIFVVPLFMMFLLDVGTVSTVWYS